jgi:predicted Zn-dependent protease
MLPRSHHFSTLVERSPDNELFRFSLAQALITEGRPEEAAPHFTFCVAKKNDWMMPRILLGKIHLGAHRNNEARPLLEAALKLAIEQAHEEPERELRALLADLR